MPKKSHRILDGTDGAGTDVTLGKFFTHLAGGAWKHQVLDWPPDVFCLVAAVLHKSGGYIRYIYAWPPAADMAESKTDQLRKWKAAARRIGSDWWYVSSLRFESSTRRRAIPREIVVWWTEVIRNTAVTLRQLHDDSEKAEPKYKKLWNALLQLASCADEACIGMGQYETSEFADLPQYKKLLPKYDILWVAQQRLVAQQVHSSARSMALVASTLTRSIKPSLAAVLPKFHTPQSGITLRSISHNLAFVRPCEVFPLFAQDFTGTGQAQQGSSPRRTLNLVLVPWPLHLADSDIRAIPKASQLADEFGFFSFEPKDEHLTADQLTSIAAILDDARLKIGQIDLVVFPELALSEWSAEQVGVILGERFPDGVLVTGIRSNEEPYGTNKARISQNVGKDLPPHYLDQHKHHRWHLNDSQVKQYALGSVFPSTKRGWWEKINIKSRALHFSTLADNISLSVLVCEDLARQDPAAEFIRCVGPNLVIALLMDGPQLSHRWSARYATVFADDPGSSVLTLTSLGMANRSKALGRGPQRNRVIALWKDHFGRAEEIELQDQSSAVALTLVVEAHPEWTADGRDDSGTSIYLRFKKTTQLSG